MTPRIGVVVVHYGTDELTLRCLRALLADRQSPPRRIVLVDNGPGAGVAERVRAEVPEVEVIVAGRNAGFAGGCNLGIDALGPIDLVALVNSDVLVADGWLTPLVAALDADPGLGAVVPKTVFEGRFHELSITAAQSWRPGRGDPRSLAWQPKRIEVDGVDVTDRCQLVEGFWEPGRGGRWAGEQAVLRIPSAAGARVARLTLATPPRRAVDLTVTGAEGSVVVRAEAGDGAVVDLPLRGTPEVVLANVGNERRADGYGVDRGRFEVDRGQHDVAGPVPFWCGGAVLLRGAYLRDVGAFDETLFLYYEDLELGLRGAARGWRYHYEPAAVVQHRVGSSSAGGETRSEQLKERNRLLVLARHPTRPRPRPRRTHPHIRTRDAGVTEVSRRRREFDLGGGVGGGGGVGVLVAELVRFVAVTAAYGRREILAPLLRGARPCGWLVKVRVPALLGALPRIPRMLARGRADRRRAGESPPWPDC